MALYERAKWFQTNGTTRDNERPRGNLINHYLDIASAFNSHFSTLSNNVVTNKTIPDEISDKLRNFVQSKLHRFKSPFPFLQ